MPGALFAEEIQPVLPQFAYQQGQIYCMDCVDFLNMLPAGSVDTIFADPPYNIKKATWDDLGSTEEYCDWSERWIRAAARALKKNGTLYICGFSEILADLKRPAMKYFVKCRWLIWHYENKANLGHDWGRSHESILCLRKSHDFTFNIDNVRIPYNAHTLKYPKRGMAGQNSQFESIGAGKVWMPNPRGAKPKDVIDIPTTCNGMAEKTSHPTQKPEELLRYLLLASTKAGDLIADPFSGSGTTAVAAAQLGRRFLVGDQNADYNRLADERLRSLEKRSPEEWQKYDRENMQRRRQLK